MVTERINVFLRGKKYIWEMEKSNVPRKNRKMSEKHTGLPYSKVHLGPEHGD